MDKAVQSQQTVFAAELSYLKAVRSLRDDDRFKRWLAGFRNRFDQTLAQFDGTNADDTVTIATIKGTRRAYSHELAIIEDCDERISYVEERLAEIGKALRRQKEKGTEARKSTVAPPKETK